MLECDDLDAIDWLLDVHFPFSTDTSCYSEDSKREQSRKKVVKCTTTDVGCKISKKPTKSTTKVFKKGMTVTEAIMAHGPMPNMSRRPPTNVLVAFPLFDKCDSLIYFPHSFVRNLNCGDVTATAKLINKHTDSDCQVLFKFGGQLYDWPVNIQKFVQCLQISEDLEPDRIMCVHSTKVMNNQIKSVVYLKVTDSQLLYEVVCSNIEDEAWRRFSYRKERFDLYASSLEVDESVKQTVRQYMHANDDVLLYMKFDLTLTFDDYTKKIVCLECDYHLTSMQPSVPKQYCTEIVFQ